MISIYSNEQLPIAVLTHKMYNRYNMCMDNISAFANPTPIRRYRAICMIELKQRLKKMLYIPLNYIKSVVVKVEEPKPKPIPKKYEFWFCDELWKEIKEFAGIYNYNINWDKLLMKNQSHILQRMINFTFPDSNKELPACHFKKDETLVRKQFWKKVNNGEFKTNRVYIYSGMDEFMGQTKYNKKYVMALLNYHFKVWTLPMEHKVGDEIIFSRGDYAGDSTQRAGKITSIAKDRKSYKIDEYECIELYSKYTEYNDIKITYGWNKNKITKSLIKSDKKISPFQNTYERWIDCQN